MVESIDFIPIYAMSLAAYFNLSNLWIYYYVTASLLFKLLANLGLVDDLKLEILLTSILEKLLVRLASL